MLIPLIALVLVFIVVLYFVISNAKKSDEGNRRDA